MLYLYSLSDYKHKTQKNFIIYNWYSIINAENENLPFWSLIFHGKKDKQTIQHNKGKSVQIKESKP